MLYVYPLSGAFFQRVGLCSCIFTASLSSEEGTLVTLVSVGLLAVGIAYVVWRAWPKRVNPPWGISEFHRRMGSEPPRRAEKLGARDD
jgi:hypothetical protein